ncbi:hypothetical protein B1J92_J07106g [Nakaseomyces glabratus]|nr:hypothetical protein B1J91_J07106g [Nakaseomyces glabratus]OXB47468.1 hypothetical protein B1J92_J07106g [Nakaseomyces glabratus]
MSNLEASKVYELIVSNVINEVREDFESAGIDEQTLQDLKRVWQEKLTETKVTHFSWDPVTDAVPATNETNQQETSTTETNGLQLPGGAVISAPSTGNDMSPQDENTNNAEDGDATAGMLAGGDDDLNNNENNVSDNNVQVKQEGDVKFEMTIENADTSDLESKNKDHKEAKRSALLDADEVGSELDDSDDNYLISEGEDEGPDENIILCLYDKVTRTKARWKCTLKDGIATVNRKDYSFQKAQVEAEWV